MAYPKEVAGLNLLQMSTPLTPLIVGRRTIIVAKGNPLQTIDERQVAVSNEV